MYKAKSKEQLADEYGVSRRTLYNWFKQYKIEVGHGLMTPKQLEEIYAKLGNPNSISINR